MKKIAVILSVYKNDELFAFQKCINSLLHQSYQGRVDVWIQFDGQVKKEIRSFLEEVNTGNIFVNKREINRGLAYSLNELLEKLLEQDYEYIARMDADDICTEERLQLQVEYMENHSDIDICGGAIEEMDEHEYSRMVVNYPLEHDKMCLFFGRRNPIAHVTAMFRKSYFEKAGLYPTDTNKDEDTMFWLKGFKNGCKFANIEQVLVRVRVSDDFYKRRNGFAKSYGDFKNRCCIIRELHLPSINYFFAFVRFCIFVIPIPGVTHLAYKLLRN